MPGGLFQLITLIPGLNQPLIRWVKWWSSGTLKRRSRVLYGVLRNLLTRHTNCVIFAAIIQRIQDPDTTHLQPSTSLVPRPKWKPSLKLDHKMLMEAPSLKDTHASFIWPVRPLLGLKLGDRGWSCSGLTGATKLSGVSISQSAHAPSGLRWGLIS